MNYLESLQEMAGEVESERPYQGYWYSISDVITILVIGLLCSLQSAHEIWQWSTSKSVQTILNETFGIKKIASYAQFMNILGNVKADSLNALFMKWCISLVPGGARDKVIAIDGKTIRSTGHIQSYQQPLHIVSAHISEYGVTIGQLAVDAKSNEIPAVQALIELLDVKNAIVVADALNCQKKTAEQVIDGGGDYLLAVKENHKDLYDDIKLYMEEKGENLAQCEQCEKAHGRVETRIACVTHDVDWCHARTVWSNLSCFGAVRRISHEQGKTSDETRYYISSRKLSAEELLVASRREWGVESMHWLLDIIFDEDRTLLMNHNAQRTLNILRKTALNLVKTFKRNTSSKQSLVGIMRGNLFEPSAIPTFFSLLVANRVFIGN